MRLICFFLTLLAFSSCRNSKVVETATLEIDTTAWHTTLEQLKLTDLEKNLDMSITVTRMVPSSNDSNLTIKEKTLYEVVGKETYKESVETSSVESKIETKTEQTQSHMIEAAGHPKKLPNKILWVLIGGVLAILIVFMLKKK